MPRSTSLIAILAVGLLLADPAAAQSRRKDPERRIAPREQPSSDRGDRRRDDDHESDRRIPNSEQSPPRPRRDDHERETRDRDHGIVGPITVFSPRLERYDGYDRYDRYGRGNGRRVWGRTYGMSCLQLDDELEWAHDEWHYRNDGHRAASWYDVEHARLQWRIEEERAYSGCGRARQDRECRDRGHYPRTGSALETAILVLDILLGDGRSGRW